MTIRKLFSAAFLLLIFTLQSCTKADRKDIQTKAKIDKVDPVIPDPSPGEQVAMTNLTELTEIEPGIYWCYYNGISMKFKNLVYQIAEITSPAVYADLFWIEPASNCNIQQGENFSSFFVINETICQTGLQTADSIKDTIRTYPGVGIWEKTYVTINQLLPYGNPTSYYLGAGDALHVWVATGRVGEQIFYKTFQYRVTGSLCSSWAQKKVVGKLFTKIVDGVRKFYVAPPNYPDPVVPPLE